MNVKTLLGSIGLCGLFSLCVLLGVGIGFVFLVLNTSLASSGECVIVSVVLLFFAEGVYMRFRMDEPPFNGRTYAFAIVFISSGIALGAAYVYSTGFGLSSAIPLILGSLFAHFLLRKYRQKIFFNK